MTNLLTRHAVAARIAFRRFVPALPLLLLLCAAPALAQTTSTSSDTTTPKALSPGAPAGSYPLSGFEHVNLYNGNLDFHLPLLHVGGRGSAGYTMMLAIDAKKWGVRHSQTETTETWTPTGNGWNDLKPGYGPGTLVGRQSGADVKDTSTCANHSNTPNYYQQTVTTLTFTAADGTEYDLRDQLNGGQRMPVTQQCPTISTQGASRGTVFVTADGTAATFVSDTVITDKVWFMGGAAKIYPSGVLFLRDGTRYFISGGTVSAIQDRNGNRVTFGYDTSSRVTTATDSLGRTVTIAYDITDPARPGSR
jgi:YD repeat-containing protein